MKVYEVEARVWFTLDAAHEGSATIQAEDKLRELFGDDDFEIEDLNEIDAEPEEDAA